MNGLKSKNMMRAYDGFFCGSRTVQAVQDGIPEELVSRLTGRELGLVMSAVNAAYHRGKSSLGGLDLCDDAVWIPDASTERGGQLIPLLALRRIQIMEHKGSLGRTYSMSYEENF